MNNEEALLVLAAILPDVSPCPEAIEKERARLDAEQAKAGWKIEPSKEAFAKQSKVFAERLVEYERELIASTAASELAAFHDATVQVARKIQGLGFQDKRLDKKGEVNKQIKRLLTIPPITNSTTR